MFLFSIVFLVLFDCCACMGTLKKIITEKFSKIKILYMTFEIIFLCKLSPRLSVYEFLNMPLARLVGLMGFGIV